MKWLVAALVAAAASAHAQTWPAKPVRLIVSQAAGGAPDILARLVADGLSKRLGQQFVVDNRPGSANMVGAQAAARSAPDGATFFFATAAALVTNQHTFKTLPYDPVKDFDAVAMVGKAPFLVMAHPSVPAKNMAELLALDKAEPGKLAFATDGPRNFTGMVAAWSTAWRARASSRCRTTPCRRACRTPWPDARSSPSWPSRRPRRS